MDNAVSPLPEPEAPLAMMEIEKTPGSTPMHDMPPPPDEKWVELLLSSFDIYLRKLLLSYDFHWKLKHNRKQCESEREGSEDDFLEGKLNSFHTFMHNIIIAMKLFR